MLNQSFTADNFENIYDIENRKNSIVEYLGTEYKEVLAEIKLLQNNISQILEDYNSKKDTATIKHEKGVPRGVGISSYLSELYMENIDNEIRNLQDVIYYARYVDDIFIIISAFKFPIK
jgi:hypothetical protein